MTQREDAANDDLRVLGDAHRLGRMSREEYRSRRRHLLMSLGESDGTTARNPVARRASRTPASVVVKPVPVSMPVMAATPPDSRRLVIAVTVSAMVVALAALVWFLRPTADEAPSRAVAVDKNVAGASDPVSTLEARAQDFVDDNRWQPADIDGFLASWRAADADTRAQVRQRPAFANLRDQIANQLRVTRLLLDDAAPDSGKAEQVKALERFEHELGGASQ